jgi:hypothetical protein
VIGGNCRTDVEKDTTMKTFTLTPIAPAALTATDLRAEAQSGMEAYRITIFDADGRPAPETAEALYAEGRLGVAWGGDATWADVPDVERGLEMWLNDGEAWKAAN